jgi:hypothetical protein
VTDWVLWLPWSRPPLSLNRHLHYMQEHRLKEQLRDATIVLAKQQRIPRLEAAVVELHWLKGDNRRADSDNIAPTLKPCIDGLRAAGVLDDDDASRVRPLCRVVYRRDRVLPPGGHLALKITATTRAEVIM